MLFNRIQSTSTLLNQTQFSFATKNLKLIKLRMKAVESIKKITKVYILTFLRLWRWSLPQKWSKMSPDSKRPSISVLDQSKKSLTAKLSFKRKSKPLHQRNGLLFQSPQIKGSAVVSTQVSSDKSKPWWKPIEAHTKFSSLETRVQWLFQDSFLTSWNTQLLTSKLQWTSQQVRIKNKSASSIAYQVLEHAKDCDRIIILYNEFKNVISQFLRKSEVLTKEEFLKSFKYVVKHDAEEPDLSHASSFFYEFYANTMFYNAILNNIASEQSSRMNAMENASKNAGEILTKLTLDYNKARQAKITMELC